MFIDKATSVNIVNTNFTNNNAQQFLVSIRSVANEVKFQNSNFTNNSASNSSPGFQIIESLVQFTNCEIIGTRDADLISSSASNALRYLQEETVSPAAVKYKSGFFVLIQATTL